MDDDYYHTDLETWSPVDLKKVGAHRYAEEAEILMASVAKNNDTPVLWVNPLHRSVLGSDPQADALLDEIQNGNGSVYAHNASFEEAVISTTGQWDIAPERWRCTARLAGFAGVQVSLSKAGADLSIPRRKDKGGVALIKKFCCPQADGSRVYPWQDPMSFIFFGAYCMRDTDAEQQIHNVLKPFEFEKYPHILEAWINTIKMNARGFPVDEEFLAHALNEYGTRCAEVCDIFDEGTRLDYDMASTILGLPIDERKMLDKYKEHCGFTTLRDARAFKEEVDSSEDPPETFRRKTGLRPTQRDKFYKWISKHGYSADNLQGETIAAHLGDVSGEPKRVLEAYSTLSFAAPKKLQTLTDSLCRDGTVKGHFMFGGAQRTTRWSGTNSQPQNFKKLLDDERKKELLGKLENRDHMTVEDLAESVRILLRQPGGFLEADYTSIEAMIINWVAGQEDVVQMFRDGIDVYKHNASLIFGIPADEINKEQRTLGKISELGSGFGIWVNGFLAACENWGVEGVTEELALSCVKAYRESHQMVVGLWADCEDAFRQAMAKPGIKFTVANGKIYYRGARLRVGDGTKTPVVQCFLPSGRPINYFSPRLGDTPNRKGELPIKYWGKPLMSSVWTYIGTYGAKLAENLTQAIAADCMMIGLNNLERLGFEPRMLVHDQCLANPEMRLEEFSAALCDMPPWADGLPIKADPDFTPSYGGV